MMFRNFLTLFIVILCLGNHAISQTVSRKCGTDLLHQHTLLNSPDYAEIRNQNENKISNFTGTFKAGSIIKIPVVIHVIYRLESQNISDEQIHSQIAVVNKDFNKLNWDTMKVPSVWKSLIADCKIEFVLANRDPNGNMSSGITRKKTSTPDIADVNGDVVYFSSKGGQDIWDRNRYLNVWVCEISGGVYGFSSFPGAPAASDGIVIDFESFGIGGTATSPTDLGRTLTHEIGHWFNLFHLWGTTTCGDDLISDTPIQEKGNFDCPFFPSLSQACTNAPHGDMFMNFMDYTDDKCMNMFTEGQKNRMTATLNTIRSSLFNSNGYNGLKEIFTFKTNVYPIPATTFFIIEWDIMLNIHRIQLYDVNGQLLTELNDLEGKKNVRFTTESFEPGMYIARLFSENGVNSEKIIISPN